MQNLCRISARSFAQVSLLIMAACFVATFTDTLRATDPPSSVAKIEEDWELIINEPDVENNAPQVVCVTSPVNNVDGVYAALELNHGTLPEYSAGGLQLQAWNGEDWLSVRDHAATTLHHDNETVTWTMRMWLHDNKLNFKVVDGSSQSWGAFGGTGFIKLSINNPPSSLDGYNPDVSKTNSGVGFASQRVQSLKLKRVRYYNASNELLLEDTTSRTVHQHH